MRDTSFTIGVFIKRMATKQQLLLYGFSIRFSSRKAWKRYILWTRIYWDCFPCSVAKYSLAYGNYSLNLLKIIDLKSKYAKALYEILEANKYKETVFTLNEKR